jgi:hypothetical protein
MSITFKMIAPGFQAGMNVTARGGTSYTSDVNGIVTANATDVQSLQLAGFVVLPERATNAVTISTAAGVSVVPGLVNTIAASTAAVIATLPAPTTYGQMTTLVSLSTGSMTITSSACSLLDEKGNSATVLTCGKGIADLFAVGSTLYQIMQRSLNTSSGGAVYGITSS